MPNTEKQEKIKRLIDLKNRLKLKEGKRMFSSKIEKYFILICVIFVLAPFFLKPLILYLSFVISFSLIIISFIVKKYSLVLRLFAAFIIIHIIIFPNIYLKILENDSNSFEFDNYIQKVEKEKSLLKVNIDFSPKKTLLKENVIDSVLKDTSSILKKPISILCSDNLYFLDNYIIFGKGKPLYEIEDKNYHNPVIETQSKDLIMICDKSGINITQFLMDYCNTERDTISIKVFLTNRKKSFSNTTNEYINLKHEISELNKFWDYDKIFPYVLNVFNTSNINPKSRIANTTFFIHHLVIAIFVISMLVSSVEPFFKKKKKKKKKKKNEINQR